MTTQELRQLMSELSLEEKIGQLFISDWRMGPKYPSARLRGHVAVADESGCVDEAEVHQKTIFGEQHLPGTSTLIKDWFARHLAQGLPPRNINTTCPMLTMTLLYEETHDERYRPLIEDWAGWVMTGLPLSRIHI